MYETFIHSLSLSPAMSSSSYRGTPGVPRPDERYNLPSGFHIYLQIGRAWQTSNGKSTGGILTRHSDHLSTEWSSSYKRSLAILLWKPISVSCIQSSAMAAECDNSFKQSTINNKSSIKFVFNAARQSWIITSYISKVLQAGETKGQILAFNAIQLNLNQSSLFYIWTHHFYSLPFT